MNTRFVLIKFYSLLPLSFTLAHPAQHIAHSAMAYGALFISSCWFCEWRCRPPTHRNEFICPHSHITLNVSINCHDKGCWSSLQKRKFSGLVLQARICHQHWKYLNHSLCIPTHTKNIPKISKSNLHILFKKLVLLLCYVDCKRIFWKVMLSQITSLKK